MGRGRGLGSAGAKGTGCIAVVRKSEDAEKRTGGEVTVHNVMDEANMQKEATSLQATRLQ